MEGRGGQESWVREDKWDVLVAFSRFIRYNASEIKREFLKGEMPMGLIIRGAYLVDPASGKEGICDIWMEDGRVKEVGEVPIEKVGSDTQVIEAGGLTVMPGLVDLHVHLRDPGQTQKEDMATGTRAAAAGGVTSLLAMPNTTPVIDRAERYLACLERIKEAALVRVYQSGAMTMDEAGKEVADIEGMAREGILALSEDGKSVADAALCKKAFARAAQKGLLICDHCEDLSLRGDGCMHEDENAKRLGLPGIPSSTEDVITARDIILAGETGARLHLCHMSTKGAVECLRFAKSLGIHVSGEVCPHHFTLSSDDIPFDDPSYKMNPPLRGKEDVKALRQALADGTISCISTDHAPHTASDKAGSMRSAAFGIVGLETSLALSYTELVRTGLLSLPQLVEKMSLNPARVLGIEAGTLAPGSPADLVLVDFGEEWTIDPDDFLSKGRNTPFAGRRVYGRVKKTFVGGELVFER